MRLDRVEDAAQESHRDDFSETVSGAVAAHERSEVLKTEPGHLVDWYRIWGTHTAYIEPGSSWETPFVESFNGRLRDECLNIEDFANILEAQVILEDWRTEYNHYRPHQSLGGLTPAAYASHWKQHQHP